MLITTKSGQLQVVARSHYGKWVIGYCSTPAWSGSNTLWSVWCASRNVKPDGVSWTAWGKICGNLTHNGVFVARVFGSEE